MVAGVNALVNGRVLGARARGLGPSVGASITLLRRGDLGVGRGPGAEPGAGVDHGNGERSVRIGAACSYSAFLARIEMSALDLTLLRRSDIVRVEAVSTSPLSGFLNISQPI
jgi:hypothetical protein